MTDAGPRIPPAIRRPAQPRAMPRSSEIADLRARVAALEEIIANRFGILPPTFAAENMLTPKQVAFELGVSVQRVSQLVKRGKLRATRVGGRIKIDSRSLGLL